jgi:hypothetical protein
MPKRLLRTSGSGVSVANTGLCHQMTDSSSSFRSLSKDMNCPAKVGTNSFSKIISNHFTGAGRRAARNKLP